MSGMRDDVGTWSVFYWALKAVVWPLFHILFRPWAEGRYFPASYSRGKVEAATEAKTLLLPRSRP